VGDTGTKAFAILKYVIIESKPVRFSEASPNGSTDIVHIRTIQMTQSRTVAGSRRRPSVPESKSQIPVPQRGRPITPILPDP
jgi:hypothetical protein